MSGLTSFARLIVAVLVGMVAGGAVWTAVQPIREGLSFSGGPEIVGSLLDIAVLLSGLLGLAVAVRLFMAKKDALTLWGCALAILVPAVAAFVIVGHPGAFDPSSRTDQGLWPLLQGIGMVLIILTGMVAWASRHKSAQG